MYYKIYACCHKKVDFIPRICTPIQCGTDVNPPINGILHDNLGDNISAFNREYCELTAHYYAWKNEEADFYGFCHYRRFFVFNDVIKKPYIVCKNPSEKHKFFLENNDMLSALLSEYNVIAPRSEDMGISAREHYCISDYHYKEDLDLFLRVLNDIAPQTTESADKYLAQNKQFFCNMFIMAKPLFFDYCDILFTALKVFDREKSKHGDFQSDRTDGYLGEIFTGIFLFYIAGKGEKIKELPRLDASCDLKKRFSYMVFPPESKRRFVIKKTFKRLRSFYGRKN